jgi:hypothetical protein
MGHSRVLEAAKSFGSELGETATLAIRAGRGKLFLCGKTNKTKGFCWCRRRGLNSRPTVYKTAALPLSYAGICCAFNGLQIAALEHSDNLGRKLAQSLNAQTFRHQADWLGC